MFLKLIGMFIAFTYMAFIYSAINKIIVKILRFNTLVTTILSVILTSIIGTLSLVIIIGIVMKIIQLF